MLTYWRHDGPLQQLFIHLKAIKVGICEIEQRQVKWKQRETFGTWLHFAGQINIDSALEIWTHRAQWLSYAFCDFFFISRVLLYTLFFFAKAKQKSSMNKVDEFMRRLTPTLTQVLAPNGTWIYSCCAFFFRSICKPLDSQKKNEKHQRQQQQQHQSQHRKPKHKSIK